MRSKTILFSFVFIISLCTCKQKPSYNEDKNEIDTVKKYFTDGSLRSVEYKLNGKLTGLCIYYYESGGVASKYTYIDGVQEGFFQTFYSNGVLRSHGILKNDSIISGEYDIYDTRGKLMEHIKLPK